MSLNVRGRTRAAVLLAIGIVAGGALSTAIGANAADTGSGATSSSSGVARPGPQGGGTPLTGDAAQKVNDAVSAIPARSGRSQPWPSTRMRRCAACALCRNSDTSLMARRS